MWAPRLRAAPAVTVSPASASPGKQRGLSLVELMVAVALSSLIMLALAELYVNMARSQQEMAKTNSQIENARFAMQFLQYDLIHAGYWGGFIPRFDDLTWQDSPAPDDVPATVPDPCLAYATPWTQGHVNGLIGLPIDVRTGAPGTCGALLADKLADTDVLVVRYADTCIAGGVNCEPEIAGELYFEVSNCTAEILGNPYRLDNAAGASLLERNCVDLVGRRKFVQVIYFIRDYARTAGDGVPTLMRSEFRLAGGVLQQQAAQPLVEGIERFRIEVGLDNISDVGATVTLADYADYVDWDDPDNRISPTNRGDGTADEFVHCGAGCTVAQLINVVEVRLHLLARATEPTAGYTDSKVYNLGTLAIDASTLEPNFKRHVFSSNFRLYNVAGRRETPP